MRYPGSRLFFFSILAIVLLMDSALLSCSAQTKEENIKEFLSGLKENNEQKIYDISYHVDSKNNITYDDLRKQYVAVASRVINKYGLSPKSKWYIEQLPGGTSTVNIPLFSGNDTTAQSTLILSFPPAGVSNKVYNFRVESRSPSTDRTLFAPPRVKSGN
jgi:hypothetical protein